MLRRRQHHDSRDGDSPAVSVSNLTKTYDTGNGTIRAVDGVSFEIESGSVVGLLGPNGAGKTTTIKSILGLIVPTGGRIAINGIDVHADSRRAYRQVSAVLEGARNVYWRLSVRENLAFFAGLQGVPRSEVRDSIEGLVAALDLVDKLDEPVQALSRGMKQKVALACALVRETPVVFLDEPTLGLDVETSHNLRSSLRELTGRDRTIVLSSHDMDVVQDVCDRVIIMNDGAVIADDSVSELVDLFDTQVYRVRLRRDCPDPFWEALEAEFAVVDRTDGDDHVEFEVTLRDTARFYEFVEFLRENDVPLEWVSWVQPDLEEAFLSLTDRDGVAVARPQEEVTR